MLIKIMTMISYVMRLNHDDRFIDDDRPSQEEFFELHTYLISIYLTEEKVHIINYE